eukprot:6318820-Prymnesium_polylepis.1
MLLSERSSDRASVSDRDRPERLLRCFGALEEVGATARALSSKWDARVLPAHAELERLCAAAASEGAAEPSAALPLAAKSAGAADEKDTAAAAESRLAFGSFVYFVQRSPAVVEATIA